MLASGVVVAQGTLAPLTQVRILARQPVCYIKGFTDKQIQPSLKSFNNKSQA